MSLAWQVKSETAGVSFPAGWEVSRVRDLVSLRNGHPFPSDAFGLSGDLPLVRIRDLGVREFETYVSGDVPQSALLQDGDVVIGMDGDFNLQVWDRGSAALNQRMCALRPKPGVDIRFVAYALPGVLKVINDLTFSTTVKHLSSNDVLGERIVVPDLEEQRRIADFLDAETSRIDEMRRLRGEMRSLLALKREGLVENAVQAELPGEELRRVPLRYLCTEVTVGIVITPAKLYVDSDGVPALRGLNVKPGNISTDALVQISHEAHYLNRKSSLRQGDVVIVRTGQAGAAAMVPPELDGANCIDLIIVRPNPGLDSCYLEYFLNSESARREIAEHSVGSIQAHFNVGAMKSLLVPYHGLDRQREIVDLLDREMRVLNALDMRIGEQENLLAERRQALITAAVTGQFDVSTASGRNTTQGV